MEAFLNRFVKEYEGEDKQECNVDTCEHKVYDKENKEDKSCHQKQEPLKS